MTHSAASSPTGARGLAASVPAPSQPGAPWWRVSWSVPAAVRALRATIVIPCLLALTFKVLHDEQMAVFAVFGGFGTLVLTSFGGARRDKARAHLVLGLAGSVAVILGTVPVPNPNGFADGYIEAFSCTSAGNCTGAGVGDLLAVRYVFVVTEKRGHWGRLQRIRGAPNAITEVYSLSCASAGNCAVGWTSAARGGWEAFLASEKNGSWSRAFRVPGLAPDTNSVEAVTSVSCPSAGNCLAGGDGKYAFLVSEKRGRWGKAVKVSGNGRILAISCISAGNCTAAGTSHSQAFVIRERNGRLDNPRELPGSGALNVGGIAQVNAMSCTAVGECTVAGIYRNSAHHDRGFVDSQT